jgi:hypothetical protein
MIITKADIGRKAVNQKGEVHTFVGIRADGNKKYPLRFIDIGGDEFHFTTNGEFVEHLKTRYNLIRWADETEGAK